MIFVKVLGAMIEEHIRCDIPRGGHVLKQCGE